MDPIWIGSSKVWISEIEDSINIEISRSPSLSNLNLIYSVSLCIYPSSNLKKNPEILFNAAMLSSFR